MKLTKILAGALAAGLLALTASNATAGVQTLNLSGTLTTYRTNYTSGSTYIRQAATKAFNNAAIYQMISNAVAQGYVAGVAATNLPANGYIGFNLKGYDTNVSGTFYVTNKSGFSFPLSGYDANSNYYSYIELDTYDAYNGGLGFADNFTNVNAYTYNYATGSGTETAKATALLYIHDHPYYYDAGDAPSQVFGNNSAVEIQGVLQTTYVFKGGNLASVTGTLKGTGNAQYKGAAAVVPTGTFSFKQSF